MYILGKQRIADEFLLYSTTVSWTIDDNFWSPWWLWVFLWIIHITQPSTRNSTIRRCNFESLETTNMTITPRGKFRFSFFAFALSISVALHWTSHRANCVEALISTINCRIVRHGIRQQVYHRVSMSNNSFDCPLCQKTGQLVGNWLHSYSWPVDFTNNNMDSIRKKPIFFLNNSMHDIR